MSDAAMTPDDLQAIIARAEATTAGPWTVDVRPAKPEAAMVVRNFEFFGPQFEIVTMDIATDDAEFIAHARTDIPKLLAEVERLQNKQADIWAESLRAIAWCMDNGGDNLQDVVSYVTKANPYKEGHNQ